MDGTITPIRVAQIEPLYPVVSFIIYFNFSKLKDDYHLLVQEYANCTRNSKEMMDYLVKKDSLQFFTEGSIISTSIELTSIDEKKSKSEELVPKDGSTLILRFSESHCYSCCDGIFEYIDKFHDSDLNIKMVLLADFNSLRDLSIFIERLNFDIKVYNMEEKLNFKIEQFGSPYMFLIDRSGNCKNFYAIDKSNMSMLDKYLDHIHN